jgi:hypothetical protein
MPRRPPDKLSGLEIRLPRYGAGIDDINVRCAVKGYRGITILPERFRDTGRFILIDLATQCRQRYSDQLIPPFAPIIYPTVIIFPDRLSAPLHCAADFRQSRFHGSILYILRPVMVSY